MKVWMVNIIKIITYVIILVFRRCEGEFLGLNEMSTRLDSMAVDEELFLRLPRQFEGGSWIWGDYEFESGVGNREELSITNIEIWQDTKLETNISNWQALDHNGEVYLAGSKNNILFLYHYDIRNKNITLHTNKSIPVTIKTFKIISLLRNIDKPLGDIGIYLIVSTEESNAIYNLRWFYLQDHEFMEFWIWKLEEPVKDIGYFNFKDQQRLLLLHENNEYFNKTFTPAEICEFSIAGMLPQNRSCCRMLLPETKTFQICPIKEDKLMISFLTKDRVIIFEYKDQNIEQCILEDVSDLKNEGLLNAVCFDSGYMHYLATSGTTPNLFTLYNNQFIHDKGIETIFQGIGRVKYIQNLPVETYREESILLMQLEDSTVLALSWQGSDSFKQIREPIRNLDRFDLAKAIVIPSFGLLIKNFLIKFNVNLNQFISPQENKIKQMMETKSILWNNLEKQETIIHKTALLVNQSYLNSQEINGFINLREVEINNLRVNDTSNLSISLGSQSVSFQALLLNYESANKSIHMLESKVNLMENYLKNAMTKNNSNIRLDTISIQGSIEIKGLLKVEHLKMIRMNELLVDDLINNCLQNDSRTKNIGTKSFPTIYFTNNNLHVKNLNGVPITNIKLNDATSNYSDIDFSKITQLEISSNLNFSKFFGVEWKELMEKLVFKNQRKIIPGHTAISGIITASLLNLDNLNDLNYPFDYISKSGPEEAHVSPMKTFRTLIVSDLKDLRTINEIDADEFIILNADQNLEHEITFENLVIEKSFQVDANILELSKPNINPDLTLLNSRMVQSNSMFTNLHVLGNVYMQNSVNGVHWPELDDLLSIDEDNITISGAKIFLGNVNIATNVDLTIKSGMINGHSVRDFITLNTRQVLPDLSRISGNIKFNKVSYEELKELEDKINLNINATGIPIRMDKPIIFDKSPIIDKFTTLNINENITALNFGRKLNVLFKEVQFEHLKVKHLIIKDLAPLFINGISFADIKLQRISRTSNQHITGNITIKHLDLENMYAEYVNNRSIINITNTVSHVNSLHDNIFNGIELVDSLKVEGSVVTSTIDDKDLNVFLDINNIDILILRSNESIENITVEGRVNELNFTKKVEDSILKTNSHVLIKGPKKLKTLKVHNLRVQYLNAHSVNDILNAEKNQTLSGEVKVKGSVKIERKYNSTGKISDISFKDISEIIYKLDENKYKLTGDFLVHDDTFITDLDVYGYIQQKEINEFMENLIYLNEHDVLVIGSKVFNGSTNFSKNISILESLNKIDLKSFYRNAVVIDKPFSINSNIVFESDIMIEGNLTVTNNLKVGTIKGIKVEDIMDNAIYLNRPTSVTDTVAFSDVVFKSDIIVEAWNNIEINSLFVLNENETVPDTLMCIDATANVLEIKRTVNGEYLSRLFESSFMLTENQTVTGKILFLNHTHINSDFNSRFINEIDITKVISLNVEDQLFGNFVFNNPLQLRGNIQFFGHLNGIKFSKWQLAVVRKNLPFKQTITGNWTVFGNVDFEHHMHGSGSINGINIRKLSNDIEKNNNKVDIAVSYKMKNVKNLCKGLKKIKNKVEDILYKFKSFEHLDVLTFDYRVISFHSFEFENEDYIMVNFETCELKVYVYTSYGFKLVSNYSNFGNIKQYITLNHQNTSYFVTVGKQDCGQNSGNLWSLEKKHIQHVLDLGNVVDVQKLANDAFAIVVDHEVQEWSIEKIFKSSLQPENIIPISDKNVQFFSNENETLLASRDTIYELRSAELEFDEYENPFNTNNIVTFQAGIYQKEYVLLYEDQLSSKYIFICSNDLSERKILQTIKVHRPSSFLMINFDKFEENLLIFTENKRIIRIYEYKGIEGFKHHSNIKMKIDAVFHFKLRLHQNVVRRHCLAAIQNNRLIIFKAKMYGERLNMKNELNCDAD